MFLARIVGNVVCSEKVDGIEGYKFLLLKEINPQNMHLEGKHLIGVDTVKAGVGDLVMVVSGSAARKALKAEVGVDLVIIGIVDEVDVDGAK